MLARMMGATGDGLHDRLMEFSRAITGATFFGAFLGDVIISQTLTTLRQWSVTQWRHLLFLVVGERDDSTMATLLVHAAKVAKEQGHEVVLWLWNEAVDAGRKGNRRSRDGGEPTPLKDLLAPCKPLIFPSGSAGPAPWHGRSALGISSRARRSKACRTTLRPSPNVTATWHSDSASNDIRNSAHLIGMEVADSHT